MVGLLLLNLMVCLVINLGWGGFCLLGVLLEGVFKVIFIYFVIVGMLLGRLRWVWVLMVGWVG